MKADVHEVSDYGLLARWQAGDRLAGSIVVRRHTPALIRVFQSKVRRGADVEDLVQATLLAAIQAKASIDPQRSLKAYLLGIARNILLRHLRRSYRSAQRFCPLTTSVADCEPSALSQLMQRSDADRLAIAMRRIPIDFQLVLEFSYWHGLEGAEIAHVMGIPSATVRTRVHRAKSKLRSALAELDEVCGDAPAR